MQTLPVDASDQITQTNPKPYKINTLGIEFELFSHANDNLSEKEKLLAKLKDTLLQVSNGANWSDGKIRKEQRPGTAEPRKIIYFALQIPKSQLNFKKFGNCRKQIVLLAKKASQVPNHDVKFIRPVVDYNHKLVGRAYPPYTRK